MPSRAIAPVVGVTILILITLGLSGTFAIVLAERSPGDEPPMFSLSIEVDPEDAGGEIVFIHEGGTTVDVEEFELWVEIDGQPLAIQPQVPMSQAEGFYKFPNGPFNEGSADHSWSAGEQASIKIAASTNEPNIRPGSEVTVHIYQDDVLIAEASTVASG